jgi:two-component system sensor kinase FixL
VRVSFGFDPRCDFVLADKVQVQQVLLNLIRNAIESMETTNKRELTVSTSPTKENFVDISLSDTGSGIAPEISAQLFQPFVTTKRQGIGCRPLNLAHHYRSAWRQHRPTTQSE